MPEQPYKPNIWDKLTGDRISFTMENRAFNYISIVSFVVIIYCLCFDLYLGQSQMSYILVGLIIIQAILYYFSRFKRKYQIGIVVYAVCSYLTLFINYFYDYGLKGPTLILFFLIFHLLITISPKNINRLWVVLHLVIAFILVYIEYTHPFSVQNTNSDKFSYFTDVFTTYIAVIIFAFLATNYLRHYYERERRLANERAKAISVQNKQIIQQNKELARINEEKNKLFSIVSHDLKSPIDSISGYLELLSHDLVSPDERIEVEAGLLNQTKYTSELLLNLLYWSRTQMDGVVVNLQPINISEMIEGTSHFETSIAAKKGVALTLDVQKNTIVTADVEMLRIVLRNLVNNAIKFTPSGGTISIAVAAGTAGAEVIIKDSGMGIPAGIQENMFSLKTFSTNGTRGEKGIGLGLVLCKEFTEYMNGSIWFKTEIGKGSTFHLSLPLAK